MTELSQHLARAALRTALERLAAGERSYVALVELDVLDRIALVKAGLPAQLLVALTRDMSVSRERLLGWLGMARMTAHRRATQGAALTRDASERALGMATLIGQVQRIVAESGRPAEVDAPRWTATWLATPSAALGGRTPGDFMDTAEGRTLVSGLVSQMQSGAYA
jgi:putative toxin-antitoxin system antitoxin component (TIGR02293 family)